MKNKLPRYARRLSSTTAPISLPHPRKIQWEKLKQPQKRRHFDMKWRTRILHLRFKRKWKLLQSYFAQPSRQQRNWDEKWTFCSPRIGSEKRKESTSLSELAKRFQTFGENLHLPRNGEQSAKTKKDDLGKWRLIQRRSSLSFFVMHGRILIKKYFLKAQNSSHGAKLPEYNHLNCTTYNKKTLSSSDTS